MGNRKKPIQVGSIVVRKNSYGFLPIYYFVFGKSGRNLYLRIPNGREYSLPKEDFVPVEVQSLVISELEYFAIRKGVFVLKHHVTKTWEKLYDNFKAGQHVARFKVRGGSSFIVELGDVQKTYKKVLIKESANGKLYKEELWISYTVRRILFENA